VAEFLELLLFIHAYRNDQIYRPTDSAGTSHTVGIPDDPIFSDPSTALELR
jgi:hypothetical protein